MYKSAGYRVFSDCNEQRQLEARFAPLLYKQKQRNLQAFRQHIPALADLLNGYQSSRYSLLCDKAGYLNIVDFSIGQVFYPDNPAESAEREVRQFMRRAPLIYLSDSVSSPERYTSLPPNVDVLVMLGLGMGYQLLPLLSQTCIKHLIIYEPAMDIFACSAQSVDWASILDLAYTKGTALYLQIGQDGSTVPSDLTEISQSVSFEHFYLYRHYSHSVMDKVWLHLQKHSADRQALLNSKLHFDGYTSLYDEAEPRHADPLGVAEVRGYQNEMLYQKNLAALEKYYPQVFSAIKLHHSSHWLLVMDHKGKPNLYHQKRQVLFYRDYQYDSEQLIADFSRHPFQDDVLIGSKPGYKLRSYLHSQKVLQLMTILDRSVKKHSRLPDELDSLILFGIALGEHVTLLMNKHRIKQFYLCEPNLDFFAASLHVTDWARVFEQIADQGGRLYLNLGGDGSEYFIDLMRQFYQVGAFSIANTHLLTSYYNTPMNKAIRDLRDELRVVLAIGEYFDHARYGIAHTYGNFKNGAGLLRKNFGQRRQNYQQIPVFIVGNGPSLDQCFEYLQQYKEQVIIISCGTALKALHEHGIQPDFHAELEQNRATYEWITQVEDPYYLKKITLLSVNGIHPDTMTLFKDTLLCFKEAEASTQLYQALLEKDNVQTESLSFAYPTVTNMAMNTVLKLGFESIYLFGIDLGFVDINYHHSRSSAYYKHDGTQIYDYQRAHGGGIPSAGNFLPWVFTKPEFDVSRKLLEQSIAKASRRSEVYNCSNGVKISGAIPLLPDDILLSSAAVDKTEIIEEMQAGYHRLSVNQIEEVKSQLDLYLLKNSIKDWLELIEQDASTELEARQLIEQQWKFLLKTKLEPGNPTFMLFNGSTNYFSAIMLKLITSTDDKGCSLLPVFNEVLALWREYIQEALISYCDAPYTADSVSVAEMLARRKQGGRS